MQRRRVMCEWLSQKLERTPGWINHIWFSDEAHEPTTDHDVRFSLIPKLNNFYFLLSRKYHFVLNHNLERKNVCIKS